MTTIQVDVHHLTHTCAAHPDEPHPYDTRRTIVALMPGGPCRRPVTVRSGDATAVIACGRHTPTAQQCPACRTTVLEHAITATFTGHHGSQHQACQPMPTGLAAHPCRICGGPLAAALADHGIHLLCQSSPRAQHPTHGNAA
jgi:hypothetical protein